MKFLTIKHGFIVDSDTAKSHDLRLVALIVGNLPLIGMGQPLIIFPIQPAHDFPVAVSPPQAVLGMHLASRQYG